MALSNDPLGLDLQTSFALFFSPWKKVIQNDWQHTRFLSDWWSPDLQRDVTTWYVTVTAISCLCHRTRSEYSTLAMAWAMEVCPLVWCSPYAWEFNPPMCIVLCWGELSASEAFEPLTLLTVCFLFRRFCSPVCMVAKKEKQTKQNKKQKSVFLNRKLSANEMVLAKSGMGKWLCVWCVGGFLLGILIPSYLPAAHSAGTPARASLSPPAQVQEQWAETPPHPGGTTPTLIPPVHWAHKEPSHLWWTVQISYTSHRIWTQPFWECIAGWKPGSCSSASRTLTEELPFGVV